MAKAERAVLSCPVEPGDAKESPIPSPQKGVDRVEYEVELHSMVQVWPLRIGKHKPHRTLKCIITQSWMISV